MVATSAALAPSWAPQVALAQPGMGSPIAINPDLSRQDVAGPRVSPEYAPQAILVGPVFVHASVSAIGGADTNVFNRPNAKGDAVLLLAPALSLNSNMARHELGLSAQGLIRRFATRHTENSEAYSLTSHARFDLGARDSFTQQVDFGHFIEPRSSAGTVADAAEPQGYDRFYTQAQGRFALGRWHLAPAVSFQRLSYANLRLTSGDRVGQQFRDTHTISGQARIDYDLPGLVSAYVSGTYSEVTSPHAPAERQRDSRNVMLLGGIRGDLTPVLWGEVGIGYQSRHYREPVFKDFAGLTYKADIQWFVTPLVTVRAQVNRQFRNSGNRNVAGILADELTLSAYYEVLRNLRIAAELGAERDNYRDVDTTAWRTSAGMRAAYQVSRHVSVGGYATLLRQRVTGIPIVARFTSFETGIGLAFTL